MRILQNQAPFYPDRAQVNFSNATVTDDITNLCTTVNMGAPTSLTIAAPGAVNVGDGAVTQITSITTAVILNAASGAVTTVSAPTAAQAVSTFTVTNSACASTSVVVASLGAYSGTFGTNGTPIVTTNTVAAGSFKVTIYNAHAANALAGTLQINFLVC